MASSDDNKSYSNEKYGSPAASEVEPVSVGSVSGLKRRFNFSLAVHQEESSFAATKSASNADFDPIPPSKRTWKWHSYVAYWMADAWAVSNWEVASSMISVGLTWKMAIGACVLGNLIMGLVITINGRMGATLHTPFPVLARMPFGYYFSQFVVLSRCVLAIVVSFPRRNEAFKHILTRLVLSGSVFKQQLVDNVWRFYSPPSGQALRISPIIFQRIRGSQPVE
jgi:NCS1 family nucleobase:cation symporter-1